MRPEISLQKITDGLGFGHGLIDGTIIDDEPDAKTKFEQALESPQLLVAVDVDKATGEMLDDDGCGDGRGVGAIFKLQESLKRSLNRAKVFGGGATMAMATRIGLGLSKGASLVEKFKTATTSLTERKINFGGHTADHVKHDGQCGCGAIDEAEDIIRSAVRYETNIRASISALEIAYDGINEELDEVFANYNDEADLLPGKDDSDYSGRNIMQDVIVEEGKVVKQLTGPHREIAILLNKVYGYTVDQKFVREVTNEKAQVFAVDIWRLQRIADGLYEGNAAKQRKAFLSEVIYTLAAASVLTKGNLPVYAIEATAVAIAV